MKNNGKTKEEDKLQSTNAAEHMKSNGKKQRGKKHEAHLFKTRKTKSATQIANMALTEDQRMSKDALGDRLRDTRVRDRL